MTILVAGLLPWPGCRFNPVAKVGSGLDAGRDAVSWWDAGSDAVASRDGVVTDGALPDGPPTDGPAPDRAPVCAEGTFECLTDTSARVCANGAWSAPRRCFLGCVAGRRECRDPSNVDTATLGFDENGLGDLSRDDDLVVNTDTGEIQTQGGAVIRQANHVNNLNHGIGFYRVSSMGADLGVFVLSSWTIPAGRTVSVRGQAAFVALVAHDVHLMGRIDAGAHGVHGGPGGFDGGAQGQPGLGPCHGSPGSGTTACNDLCSSGSGGGGHGGAGGGGGAVNCENGAHVLSAGTGGSVCGNDELQPLVGGSGGAGGAMVTGYDYGANSEPGPGPGGGGGGAVQISLRGRLVLGSGGGILVPGAGGGETTSGGGSGGGAGGAILLEAGEVVADADAFLAANGGGGGGGDCT